MLKRAIKRLFGRIRAMYAEVKSLRQQMADLQRRFNGFEAKADAMAVPPGSTLPLTQDVRLFRVSAADPGDGTLTAKLQTIDSDGVLIDDPNDAANYTLYKLPMMLAVFGIGDVVSATFEGTASPETSEPRYRYFIIPSVCTHFLAKLTAVSAISAAAGRWVYDFAEVALAGTFSGGTITGVSATTFTGGRTGKAINLAEVANTTTRAFATHMSTGYPASYKPMPVSGGSNTGAQTHQQDVIVVMCAQTDPTTGFAVYHFSRMSTHDGNCP